ncbi:conserved Plasmodium protein, unknown function [Plasmodium ovale wallikeri]|uniref:Uncharacterized protein n=1 Tax=Plasmodium ovale wallikeri TaxID=864142 RepID=A0A1A8YYF6_PLAOA|nr:conserved Plasmodium protein, unknown function [Plasmodium ovale wallikeri]SBT37004.1 conserved Plasmodium protein, unknown function [Plasmodium ovale wallikeri]
MATMSENHLASLKRMKEISKMIEATLQQNNRLKNILASELYFRKKCEASLEIVNTSCTDDTQPHRLHEKANVNSTTDEQECYRKVSKIFIRKPREILMKELNEEIAQYNKHTPHLVELRKKLVDKLSNLKEQYLQTHETIEREVNTTS